MCKKKCNMETKFNFKSAVCTDRNQSERLLVLGLKKETADMYYSTILENDDIARVCYEDFWNSNKAIDGYIRRRCIPAWSLHRLVSLCNTDNIKIAFNEKDCWGGKIIDERRTFLKHNNLYDNLCDCIEWLIKEGYFNKEYLV